MTIKKVTIKNHSTISFIEVLKTIEELLMSSDFNKQLQKSSEGVVEYTHSTCYYKVLKSGAINFEIFS